MIVYVGDIHGEIAQLTKIVQKYTGAYFVFLGDIFDSYERTVDEQLQCFDIVRSIVDSGNGTLLLGNHELSYLDQDYRCSGYNPILQVQIDTAWIMKNAKLYYWGEHHLVTHAGINEQYYSLLADMYKTYSASMGLRALWEEFVRGGFAAKALIGLCGVIRGGRCMFGGPLWSDLSEFDNIYAPQIFGHTKVQYIKEIRHSDKYFNYCIDCGLEEVLIEDNGMRIEVV